MNPIMSDSKTLQINGIQNYLPRTSSPVQYFHLLMHTRASIKLVGHHRDQAVVFLLTRIANSIVEDRIRNPMPKKGRLFLRVSTVLD